MIDKIKSLINEAVAEGLQLEKLALPNFDEYAKMVAEAYSKAPAMDSKAAPHWAALMKSTESTLYPKIDGQIKRIYKEKNPNYAKDPNGGGVQIVDYHPYQNQEEMKKEVLEKGIFRVSSADSDHPLWSVEQNVKFRAVHDWYTHIQNNAGFSLRGEIRAYNTYTKLIPREAIPAAFTEIVGQACYAIVNGTFAEQKICILDQFDWFNVGALKDKNSA